MRLDGIRKAYKGQTAVEAMSIAIEPGEFFTILGPSGCGKTTTLMMIAGFASPDAGHILLDDRDVTGVPPYKREIGVVFQNYAMFPHMTVAENVGFSLKMRDMPRDVIRQRVTAALALVQLTERETHYPRELSGGQQQRVALARALVFEPRLLLLDEPLGALDRLLREHMKLELRRVHRTLATTMIYVTHDQDEALVLSDRIMVMNNAGIEQIGTPQDIYERPASPFVARFIGENNFLNGTVSTVADGRAAVMLPTGAVVHGTPSGAVAPGGRALLAVRPGKIAMSAADAAGAATLSGVVTDSIYYGDALQHIVRLDDGTAFAVKDVRRSPSPGASQGERVTLSWRPEDAIVYREP